MIREGDDISLGCEKLCHEMPRIEGQGASEDPQLVALRDVVLIGTYLKSYGNKAEAPEIIEANRETPVKYFKGSKSCTSKNVMWPTAQLKSLYTNMGNKQEELEATMLLEGYILVAITETW
ncbi:hypothetical protein AV530_017088 [Patagioenas fasciata monilis]|uniref:Uncharacterized protein n=1 Tax=Patagioenas fasciata monilis TaxID=372326 RepID=A0A1V4K9X4_PATFA|nr:hypothetical protein AV530_017088 [Patagioenas fasciata monilis]